MFLKNFRYLLLPELVMQIDRSAQEIYLAFIIFTVHGM